MNDTLAWILGTICWLVSALLIGWMIYPAIAGDITYPECHAIYVDHAVYNNDVPINCWYI